MRKLQVISIYITLLLMLFFIPKPESLLKMETYESKLRNIEQKKNEKEFYIVNTPHLVDTFSYIQQIP